MQIHKSILHSSFSCIPSRIGVFEFNDDRKTRRTQKPDRFLWPLVNWHETGEMVFTVGLPIPNASTHMENLGCKGWPKPRSILLSPSCYLICWLTDVINGDIQLLFVDFLTSFFIWFVPYYPTSFFVGYVNRVIATGVCSHCVSGRPVFSSPLSFSLLIQSRIKSAGFYRIDVRRFVRSIAVGKLRDLFNRICVLVVRWVDSWPAVLDWPSSSSGASQANW